MKNRVLLVEDEEDLRETMREALELNGFSVVVARDGEEALDALDRIHAEGAGDDVDGVSVVLLDLVMPRLNGWDCYAKIRERPKLDDVPVIVHSSVSTDVPAGVVEVLPKPVTLERLIRTVREYCSR